MLTKAKIIVLAVLVIMAGFIAFYVMQERGRWNRIAEARITMTYGILLIGIDDGPARNFTVDLGLAIADRLNMRSAFIASSPDWISAGFDNLEYDIFMPSMPVPAELRSVFAISRPYLENPFEPGLNAIVVQKENIRLANAINEALELLFADGTMSRISMNTFGADFVTQARQSW